MIRPLLSVLLLGTLLRGSRSWNVLIANVFAGGSHQPVSRYVANLLAAHGHQVTYLSTNIPSSLHPAVHRLDMPGAETAANTILAEAIITMKEGTWTDVFTTVDSVFRGCERFYQEPNVQKLIKSKSEENKFDLLVTFTVFDTCGMALGHALGIENTVIHAPGHTVFPHQISMLGLPLYASSHKVNGILLADSTELKSSAMARAKQLFKSQATSLVQTVVSWYYIESVVRENMPHYPGYARMYESVKLMLVHYHPHPLIDTPHPLGPGVINLGGTLCKTGSSDTDLTPELRDFIAAAEEGFIFVSFGSHVKTLSSGEQRMWGEVFARLPYSVIWKLSSSSETLPRNVKTFAWLPQTALLAHPKMKVFVTHGGYGSKMEAFCAGVPMVIVPRFAGDQFYHAEHYNEIGVAASIMDISNVSSEHVYNVIVAASDQYAGVMQDIKRQLLSTRVTDQQVLGWLDMVISGHRLLPGYQPFWEYFYLDLLLLGLLVPCTLIGLIKFLPISCGR